MVDAASKGSSWPKSADHDWDSDEYFSKRRLSPKHLLVHDVVLQPGSSESSSAVPIHEVQERLPSSFIPALKTKHRLASTLRPESMTTNRQEQIRLGTLISEYGWMNSLRLDSEPPASDSVEPVTQCRWFHISSKFSEYLEGVRASRAFLVFYLTLATGSPRDHQSRQPCEEYCLCLSRTGELHPAK
jgi:hypothetical protein